MYCLELAVCIPIRRCLSLVFCESVHAFVQKSAMGRDDFFIDIEQGPQFRSALPCYYCCALSLSNPLTRIHSTARECAGNGHNQQICSAIRSEKASASPIYFRMLFCTVVAHNLLSFVLLIYFPATQCGREGAQRIA